MAIYDLRKRRRKPPFFISSGLSMGLKSKPVKITKFSIRGYRSLKDVTWEPGDLNVLIGPNASGKSNFLSGIELVQDAGDLDAAVTRQGGLGSILWAGDPINFGQFGRSLAWRIELDIGSTVKSAPPFRDIRVLVYELSLKPVGFGGSYRIEHEGLSGHRESVRSDQVKYFEKNGTNAIVFGSDGKLIEAPPDRLTETQTILGQTSMLYARPEVFFFCRYLNKWGIYHDLAVHQGSAARRAAVTRKESKLSPNGDNLVTLLHSLYTSDRAFREYVNDSMRAAFGSEFEELIFPPAEDQRVQLRLQWKSFKTAHSAAELSDGTLRFLMLVSILAHCEVGGLIAIDEPETGLHPSMFPIIAELAAEASRSTQIIFSTHSPEFLTAIGHHNPKTTVVQNVAGETRLSTLDGDDLKKWLEKYTLGELFVSGGAEALA